MPFQVHRTVLWVTRVKRSAVQLLVWGLSSLRCLLKEETHFLCNASGRAISLCHFCPPSTEMFPAGRLDESTSNTSPSPPGENCLWFSAASPKICGESIKQISPQSLSVKIGPLRVATWERGAGEGVCADPLQLVVIKWDVGAARFGQSNHLLPWAEMLLAGSRMIQLDVPPHTHTPPHTYKYTGQWQDNSWSWPVVCVYVIQSIYSSLHVCHRDKTKSKTGSVPRILMVFHRFMCQQAETTPLATQAHSAVRGRGLASAALFCCTRNEINECNSSMSCPVIRLPPYRFQVCALPPGHRRLSRRCHSGETNHGLVMLVATQCCCACSLCTVNTVMLVSAQRPKQALAI